MWPNLPLPCKYSPHTIMHLLCGVLHALHPRSSKACPLVWRTPLEPNTECRKFLASAREWGWQRHDQEIYRRMHMQVNAFVLIICYGRSACALLETSTFRLPHHGWPCHLAKYEGADIASVLHAFSETQRQARWMQEQLKQG